MEEGQLERDRSPNILTAMRKSGCRFLYELLKLGKLKTSSVGLCI